MVDYWEGWVVLGGLQKFWVVFGGLKSFLVFQILKACVNYCLSAASPAREWAKWLNSVHVLTLRESLTEMHMYSIATSFVHIFYELFHGYASSDEMHQQIQNSKSNLELFDITKTSKQDTQIVDPNCAAFSFHHK